MSTNITDKKDLWILVHILALLANQIFGKLSSLSTLLLRNLFSWFFHGILNPKENFSDSYPQTLKSYFSLYFWVNVFSVFFSWLKMKTYGHCSIEMRIWKIGKNKWLKFNIIYVYILYILYGRGKLSIRQPVWKMSTNRSWPAWQYWPTEGFQDLINGLIWLSTRKHSQTHVHSRTHRYSHPLAGQTNKHSWSRPVGYLKCYKCFGNWLKILPACQWIFSSLYFTLFVPFPSTASNVLNNASRPNNKYTRIYTQCVYAPLAVANRHTCLPNG